MAKAWQYIPFDVLDDENLADQARAWGEQQYRNVAERWQGAMAPPPLAQGTDDLMAPYVPGPIPQQPTSPSPFEPAPVSQPAANPVTAALNQQGYPQVPTAAPAGPAAAPNRGVVQWFDMIRRASQETGVPERIIAATMDIESGGNAQAQSPMNYDRQGNPIGRAQGLMQVMPFNFKQGEDPMDPWTNVRRGATMLAERFKRYGDWDKAAASYFGAIDEKGNITGATDVGGVSGHGYVQRFNQALSRYSDLGQLGETVEAAKGGIQRAIGAAGAALPDITGKLPTPTPGSPLERSMQGQQLTGQEQLGAGFQTYQLAQEARRRAAAGLSPVPPETPVLGGLVPAALEIGTDPLSALPWTGSIRKGAALGAGLGALNIPQDATPEEVILYTTLGGVLGGGIPALGRGIAAGVKKLPRRQPAQMMLPGGGGGGALPPGPPAPPGPGQPALPSGRTPGGPGPGTRQDTLDMFERNRRVREPSFFERIGERLSRLPRDIEYEFADDFVDLNKLGWPVEVAAGNYRGRAPAATWRASKELGEPISEILGGKRSQSEGLPMLKHLNEYIKYQRDLEVASMKGHRAPAAWPGRAGAPFQPSQVAGQSQFRQASARGTGAVNAQNLLNDLQAALTPEEWMMIKTADTVRQRALDSLLDDRVRSGIISNEMREWLLHNYPHYNPTVMMANVDKAVDKFAQMGGRSMTQLFNNLRKLMDEGITSDTEEPIISATRAIMRGDLDVRRNDLVRTIIDSVEATGFPVNKRVATAPGPQPGTLSFFENGKRLIGDVPEAVERTAKNMDSLSMGPIAQLGRILNTPLRYGAVVLSPSFMIMNAVADFITTYIREGTSAAAKVPGRHVRELTALLGKEPAYMRNPAYSELIRAGGGMSTLMRAEPENIEKLIHNTGGIRIDKEGKWAHFLKDVATLGPLIRYGQAVEMQPRLATFQARRARGETVGEAALAARRATIDFARGGRSILLANSWFMFLNPRVQGMLQLGRTLRDNPNSRFRLASVAGIAMATYAWNQQYKEEWDDLPEWEKRGHAIVILGPGERDPDGTGFKSIPRISIPLREHAAFVVPLTRVLDNLQAQNPQAWHETMGQILQDELQVASPTTGESPASVVGGAVPSPLRSIFEMTANRKFFTDAPIESERFRSLPPSERYTERTTAPAFALSGLSEKIGEISGGVIPTLSPIQVDYLIQSNLAGLGRQITGERPNPLQAVARTYAGQGETNTFKELDRRVNAMQEQVADVVRQQPGYAGATRDRQLQMQRQAQETLNSTLREKYGIEPKAKEYGLPSKYRGVTDPEQTRKIDAAITKYDNWNRDRKNSPKPTPEEQRLALRYRDQRMIRPEYTKARGQDVRESEAMRALVEGLVRGGRP